MEFQDDPTLEPQSIDKVEPGGLPYTPPAPVVEPTQSALEKVDTIAREGWPELVRRAKDFYAKHPTLVKTAGVVAAAAIARRLFRGRPGLF
jgi:hypothetical protein